MISADVTVTADATLSADAVTGRAPSGPSGPFDRYAWDYAWDARSIAGLSWPASQGGVTLSSSQPASTGRATTGLNSDALGNRADRAAKPAVGGVGYISPAGNVQWPSGPWWVRWVASNDKVPDQPASQWWWQHLSSGLDNRGAVLIREDVLRGGAGGTQVMFANLATVGWQLCDLGVRADGTGVLMVNGVEAILANVPASTPEGQFGLMSDRTGSGGPDTDWLFWGLRSGSPPTLSEHQADSAELGLM